MADYVVKLNGQDNLSGTINNVKKALDGINSTAKGADKIKEKFDKIQNSSMSLTKKLSETKNQMRELAATGDTNSKLFKEMAKACDGYKKKLDEVDKAIKNVNKNPIDKVLGGGLDKITSSMGLGNVGSQISGALTNPYLAAGAAIGLAGKALYDYNVELDRSLKKTEQFTGLSGDALMSLRNGIQSVANTFGKDYDVVLSAIDGLMVQFGIDGEEALKIVRDGFVAGADDSGQMLDMISKYSGSFNDIGISASELVAIIGNTRNGIFSPEGMDAIAMAGKKIREFSTGTQQALEGVGINATEMYEKLQSGEMTTVQAMQQISSALKGLNPQAQEVGDVMKNVFGKAGASAGYELVTALADVETNLEIVKGQTGEVGQAMENLQEANREFENAMSSLFGVTEGGFSTMTTQLKADIYGAVAKVINSFIDLYNKCILLRAGVQYYVMAFKNGWEAIKVILKLFMNGLSSLGEMIEGVMTLDWNKVKSSWKNGIENVLKTVATGFENIANNGKEALDNTLNGKIKKIEVPVEATYSENKRKVAGSGTTQQKGKTGSGSSKSGSSKQETPKTELELNREAFDKITKTARQAISDFNAGLISKEQLDEAIKTANNYFKEHDIKSNIGVEYSVDKNGFEQATEIKNKKVGIEVDRAEIENVKKLVNQAMSDFNIGLISKEEMEEVVQKANDYFKTHEIKANVELEYSNENGFEKVAEKKVNNQPQAKEGSLAYVQDKISDVQTRLKLEIVGSDEYNKLAAELVKLEEEEHKIQFQIDNDGFETAMERFEKSKEKFEEIGSTVGNIGNVFSSVGGAVDGTAGEIMEFAGQSISAIGELIPQIVGLIGAKQAEAMASGTASAASMPFPANIAAIAGIIATITSVFASLPAFADGGVVSGTSLIAGDHNLARVNAGEMILNGSQQDHLFRAIDENRLGGGGMNGNISFKISGRNLVGVMNNQNSKVKKL